LVGFTGVLIVVRPGTGAFNPAAFLVFGSALCWTFAMLITRRMASTERATTTVFWTAASGWLVLTLLLPFRFTTPTWSALGLTLWVGVVSSGGQWLTILAYRHAAASVLAPLSYVQLIWSTALGFLVFHAVPDRWVLIGAVMIAASGVYTVQRERMRLRAAVPARPLQLRRAPSDAVS
jgi:drug/metabolite transporter (DMT)-like permease